MGLIISLDVFEKKDVESVVRADDYKVKRPVFDNGTLKLIDHPVKYITHPDADHYARNIVHLRKNELALQILQQFFGVTGVSGYCILDEDTLNSLTLYLGFLQNDWREHVDINQKELKDFVEKLEVFISKIDHETQYGAFSWVT